MSPRSSTRVPFTVPSFGKLTTSPPGQCASVPGLSVQPHTPTVDAPAISTSRSVPAADVTLMRLAPRSIFAAARTIFSSALSGSMRSSASGCSLEITWMRAPALRIAGVSGACIRPSMVQSTTNPAAPSAATTGASLPSASLAPVERTGTGWRFRGVGTTTWKGRAPSRRRASSARCTLSARDCVSDRIAAVSPALTAQRSNTSQKVLIHLPSMRSTNMSLDPQLPAGLLRYWSGRRQQPLALELTPQVGRDLNRHARHVLGDLGRLRGAGHDGGKTRVGKWKLQGRGRQLDAVAPTYRLDLLHLVHDRRWGRLIVVGGTRARTRRQDARIEGCRQQHRHALALAKGQQLVKGALLEQGVAPGQHDAIEICLARKAQRHGRFVEASADRPDHAGAAQFDEGWIAAGHGLLKAAVGLPLRALRDDIHIMDQHHVDTRELEAQERLFHRPQRT